MYFLGINIDFLEIDQVADQSVQVVGTPDRHLEILVSFKREFLILL